MTLKQSLIPRRYWECSLDDYVVDKGNDAREVVSDYIENIHDRLERGTGLTLCGPAGAGKTMLSCIIGRAAVEAGYSVMFVPMAQYMRWNLNLIAWGNREEFDEEWEKAQRTILKIRNKIQFLLLDDVGKEHLTSSKFAEDEFDFLVRHRYNRALPTIITSNQFVDEWNTRYSSTSMESFAKEAFPQVKVLSTDRRGT